MKFNRDPPRKADPLPDATGPLPPERPRLPERPPRPELPRRADAPPPGRSMLGIAFMAFLGLFVLSVLALLTVVMHGAIIVLGGIFLFAAFHYLVWGWWLSNMIRRESDRDQDDVDL